ncbi:MAG: thioredoxin family protein [Crocinitomicaceae bacterium]|nr:thioredoxin family protein [Crocinitomicaceae bacterium]
MKTQEYIDLFDPIIKEVNQEKPYDNADYRHYTKLNKSRQNRWLKKGELNEELKTALDSIDKPQKWILITEPWCGDAAHSVPFIVMAADYSDKIDLEIQLRDSEPHLINNYLTNGGKAIPKLVVRNEAEEDLFDWGPRPAECQTLFLKNKAANLSFEEQKTSLQQWYNNDNGVSIQSELASLIQGNSNK